MDLRQAFFNEMEKLAKADKNVIVIVGDLGYSFLEGYQKNYPKQFLNAGCAEQNMIGVACGMAHAGLKPYVYSGSVFLACRGYEFIRNDVCYNNLNVKLIGTGASDFLGPSHNFEGLENERDLLKNLPNIRFYEPLNPIELKETLLLPHSAFIRL